VGVPNGYTSAQVVQAVPTGINSGLVFIGGGTLSGASTAFNNVFSATYDNYRVYVGGSSIASSSGIFSVILGATTSGYESLVANQSGSGAYSAWYGSSSATSMRLGNARTSKSQAYIDFISPYKAETSRIFFRYSSESDESMEGTGAIYDTTAYTGFTIQTATSNFNAGTVQIFGFANS